MKVFNIRKKVLCFLLGLPILMLYLAFSRIEVFKLNVDGHKRSVYFAPADSTQDERSYVVYNTLFKSEKKIVDFLIDYHDKHILKEDIIKYNKLLLFMYFEHSYAVNRNYQEKEDGSDIIYDYMDQCLLKVKYEIKGDFIFVDVAKYHSTYTYKVPIANQNWKIITSIRNLEQHTEYLYQIYKVPNIDK